MTWIDPKIPIRPTDLHILALKYKWYNKGPNGPFRANKGVEDNEERRQLKKQGKKRSENIRQLHKLSKREKRKEKRME